MKYLICNLKAKKTLPEMLTFCNTLKNIKLNNIKLIIAPSNPYFLLFKEENINLCAQDISLYDAKMLTGDLTLKTLKSLNVKYTLIGHSERIEYYNENSDTILTKIKNALKNNLKVIYLIGETKEELDNNTKYYILEKKITYILNDIPKSEFKNIIIAYEPFYLINGGPLNIKTITETINFIKNIIKEYYQHEMDLVFGGGITTENIKQFKNIKNLDGFIVSSSIENPVNIETLINEI